MASETKQLTVNVTASNTWTQLILLGGGAYIVAGLRASFKNLRATNLGANSVTVEFALSPTSTITDDERLNAPVTLATLESWTDGGPFAAPTSYGLWGRAVGAAPNVTFAATALEVTP
jgi:hypothetical protein